MSDPQANEAEKNVREGARTVVYAVDKLTMALVLPRRLRSGRSRS